MFLHFDPMYFVFVGPAILLALWAEFRVRTAYAEAQRYGSRRGLSGAQAARRILDANGLGDVAIEQTPGTLSDHYDPRQRVLRLSPAVYEGRSLAAVGIAAHESGHALQHRAGYGPLKLRSGLVPMAATGSRISTMLIVLGLVGLWLGSALGVLALTAGLAFLGVVVLFQVVNLPVEFDASRRARLVLVDQGIVAPEELAPVGRVLNAAALTYVAATLTAILTLLYWLWRAGLLGGRRSQ